MRKPKYITEYLWNDLIALGKSKGLSDKEITERLLQIEETAQNVDLKPNIMFNLLRKKGTVK